MDVNNEDEIKIEYYEELVSDPLADLPEKVVFTTSNINEQELVCSYNSSGEESLKESFTEAEIPHWHRDIDSCGRYLCKFCDLKYSTKQTLRQHIKNKHFTLSQVLKHKIFKNKRRQRIKCHICNKNFMILSDLKCHFNTLHSTTLDKSCSYCFAVFKNVDEKNEHEINAHNGIRRYMYVCTICGYRTPKKSCYNDHQNTHSIKKEIKCKYCDYCTNKAVNLKTHERIHTNCKPYKCDFKDCNYSCSAKSGLNSHKLQHYPEENMLYCDKCQYKTVYLQSLKKHQDTHKTYLYPQLSTIEGFV